MHHINKFRRPWASTRLIAFTLAIALGFGLIGFTLGSAAPCNGTPDPIGCLIVSSR